MGVVAVGIGGVVVCVWVCVAIVGDIVGVTVDGIVGLIEGNVVVVQVTIVWEGVIEGVKVEVCVCVGVAMEYWHFSSTSLTIISIA